MNNIKKQPIKMNEEKSKNKKIIQFYNTEGIIFFDIHPYSDKGTLCFKRKNALEVKG